MSQFAEIDPYLYLLEGEYLKTYLLAREKLDAGRKASPPAEDQSGATTE